MNATALKKIMIVDDNAAMRETIQRVLASTQATFYQCQDGRAAIAMFDNIRPDWLLMDIELRDLDGFRVTEAIKRQHPNAKVIFVSHYNDLDFRAEAKRLQSHGYVLKERLRDLRAIIFGC